MKKIIAIIGAFAAVVSFASCSVKPTKTTAELVSEQEAEYQEIIESLTQAELEVSEKVVENVGEIGKTQKNKRLVIKMPYANGERYQIFIINRKGVCEKVEEYYFYNTAELFELNNEKQKEKTRKKKIASDKDARMIAYESDHDIEGRNTFDQLYDFYNTDNFKNAGYEIIE